MTSFTGLSPNNPRDYVGPNVALNTVVTRNREPTGADYRQPETGKLYPFNTFWLVGKNPTTGIQGDLWYLSKIAANIAYWVKLSASAAGPLLTVTVPLGVTPIVPDGVGNINFTSTGGTVNITGSSASPNNHTINFDLAGSGTAIDSFQVQAATAPGVNPVTGDVNGLVTVNGSAVAAHSVPIETRTRALNAYNVEVQYSSAVASTTASQSGLSHFNSAQFSVDANGFVSLSGGGAAMDSFTTDLFGPVSPDGSGNVAFTGATNIFSDGSVANTMRLNLQGTNFALFVGRGNQVASASLSTGTAGQILQSSGNAADPVWVDNPLNPIDPNDTLIMVDDFMGMVSGTATVGNYQWVSNASTGFYNGASLPVEAGHPGIIGHSSFATAGTSPILVMGGNGGPTSTTIMAIGGGALTCRWIFKINTLSTGTNTYTLNLGLADAFGAAAADQSNGLYFVYSNGINSGNWQIKSALAAARTTTNTGVAVTTGWHKADVVVNAAGTSAEFFMDGVSLGTIAATMPSNTTNISPFVSALRSAGTIPANALAIDLFYLTQTLTTSR